MTIKLTKNQDQFLSRVALDLKQAGHTDPTREEIADAMVTRLNRESDLMNRDDVIAWLCSRVWREIREESNQGFVPQENQ